MKTLIRVIVIIGLLTSQMAQAKNKSVPPQPPSPTGPATFEINPTSVRERVLGSNLTLSEQLNKVKDSKDNVWTARASLLPSLNVGGLISSGNFLIGSIEFLLPFLLPSNWANYKASKAAFEAEKISYQILELNTYSSAMSLYLTVLSDQKTAKIFDQEYADLKEEYDILTAGSQFGAVSQSDILTLQSQMDLAGNQSAAADQLVAQEISLLRQAFYFPVSTNFVFDDVVMPVSEWEDKPVQAAIDQASRVAPEHIQISYLISAAKSQKWATAFGWINGATMSSQSNNGANAGFSGMSTKAQVSLGFALWPELKIANRNIEEVAYMDKDLLSSNTQIIESSINSVKKAKDAYDSATQAADAGEQAYDILKVQSQFGAAKVTDLLIARVNEAAAQAAQAKAQLALNLQRVVLHRALLTDQFAQIPSCQNIDLKNPKHLSLDQLCREGLNKSK